jgi:hypothetical protein
LEDIKAKVQLDSLYTFDYNTKNISEMNRKLINIDGGLIVDFVGNAEKINCDIQIA